MQRTVLDRLIGVFSPAAELHRLRHRAALDMLARNYEAASSGRRASGWRASGGSAQAIVGPALATVRARARDLEANNPLAASLAQQFAGRVIGTGITPRFSHGSKRVRVKAEEAWRRFVETCDPEGLHDWHGLADLAAAAMFSSGEALLRWRMDAPGRLSVQVLEGDHLDETRDASLLADRNDRAGVSFDAAGRRIGYWLYPTHPGDTWRPSIASEMVGARDVDHLFHRLRPGQVRGMPWLAPALLRLKGFDQIHEAIEMRKRLEACIGLVVTSPEAGVAPQLGAQAKADDGRVFETMSPGMIHRLGPGEDVTTLSPASSDGVIEYMRGHLMTVCHLAGVPYSAATGDGTQVNFASQRTLQLATYVILDRVQWLTVIPRIMKPAVRRVLEVAALQTGEPRLREVAVEWSTPVRPWVDPVKEVQAKIMEVRGGLQSMPDALAERGVEWSGHLDEIKEFTTAMDALGLVFDTDGRKVTKTGAASNPSAQPPGAPDADPEGSDT